MPGSRRRRIARLVCAMLLLGAMAAGGCGSRLEPPIVTVGATAYPESILLAHIYAGALRGSGVAVQISHTDDPMADLAAGALDVAPGFTGRLLTELAPHAAARSPEHVYRMLLAALPEGIGGGDYATGADDKPALVVTAATVAIWGADDLTALRRHCREPTVGVVADRPHPARVGDCTPGPPHRYPDAASMFTAVLDGHPGKAAAWTTAADPAVPDALVMLADPEPPLLRAENPVPLYRRHVLAEPQLLALNQVAGVLDTASLVTMGRSMLAGAGPEQLVETWLYEHPLGR